MQSEIQTNRFKGAAWFPQHDEMVVIGGAGGIGSWLTFFLSRAGFKPLVYDDDSVEEHNLGGQLFRQKDIGSLKVTAVYNIINEFVGEQINIQSIRVDVDSPTHLFMFSAFDNMEARKAMFKVWKKSIEGASVTPIFIDGRLVK